MAGMIVYGPSISTYVRTVRLALEEKGAPYELRPVNIMAGEAQGPEHRQRHPFGKVPAFEHDGFAIYETGAITRYIDQVAPGPSLTPADPRRAARMNQAIGIVDAYAYGSILGKLVWQRLVVPMLGQSPDDSIVQGSLPLVGQSLAALDQLKGSDPFLAGPEMSLADLFVAPIVGYLVMTPEAGSVLEPVPGLRSWWSAVSERPSMQRTQPQFG
jgi:glutathione S-transferase